MSRSCAYTNTTKSDCQEKFSAFDGESGADAGVVAGVEPVGITGGDHDGENGRVDYVAQPIVTSTLLDKLRRERE